MQTMSSHAAGARSIVNHTSIHQLRTTLPHSSIAALASLAALPLAQTPLPATQQHRSFYKYARSSKPLRYTGDNKPSEKIQRFIAANKAKNQVKYIEASDRAYSPEQQQRRQQQRQQAKSDSEARALKAKQAALDTIEAEHKKRESEWLTSHPGVPVPANWADEHAIEVNDAAAAYDEQLRKASQPRLVPKFMQLLNQFKLLVHPDTLASHPLQQQCNELAMQDLSVFLDTLASQDQTYPKAESKYFRFYIRMRRDPVTQLPEAPMNREKPFVNLYEIHDTILTEHKHKKMNNALRRRPSLPAINTKTWNRVVVEPEVLRAEQHKIAVLQEQQRRESDVQTFEAFTDGPFVNVHPHNNGIACKPHVLNPMSPFAYPKVPWNGAASVPGAPSRTQTLKLNRRRAAIIDQLARRHHEQANRLEDARKQAKQIKAKLDRQIARNEPEASTAIEQLQADYNSAVETCSSLESSLDASIEVAVPEPSSTKPANASPLAVSHSQAALDKFIHNKAKQLHRENKKSHQSSASLAKQSQHQPNSVNEWKSRRGEEMPDYFHCVELNLKCSGGETLVPIKYSFQELFRNVGLADEFEWDKKFFKAVDDEAALRLRRESQEEDEKYKQEADQQSTSAPAATEGQSINL